MKWTGIISFPLATTLSWVEPPPVQNAFAPSMLRMIPVTLPAGTFAAPSSSELPLRDVRFTFVPTLAWTWNTNRFSPVVWAAWQVVVEETVELEDVVTEDVTIVEVVVALVELDEVELEAVEVLVVDELVVLVVLTVELPEVPRVLDVESVVDAVEFVMAVSASYFRVTLVTLTRRYLSVAFECGESVR